MIRRMKKYRYVLRMFFQAWMFRVKIWLRRTFGP